MSEKNKLVYDEKGNMEKIVVDPEEYEKLKIGNVKEIRIKTGKGDDLVLTYEKC
ncbi:MAG: hypothetical protein ACFFCD_13485 [Promethearchaeota archaeon]